MPIRIVKSPVMIHREGKFIYPPVGERFDFTSNEVADINKVDPKALQVIEVVDDAPAVSAPKVAKAAVKAG